AIADPRREAIAASDVAVVVAHPDDETIGCGAQLARLHGRIVVLVTDGAPRNGEDARRSGFATPQAYAAARRNELLAALRHAAVPVDAVRTLNIPDQEAAFRLAPAYDFTALPNDGRLHYDAMPWGMTGKRWLELTTAALNELGIATPR